MVCCKRGKEDPDVLASYMEDRNLPASDERISGLYQDRFIFL